MSPQVIAADGQTPRIVKSHLANGFGTPIAFNYEDLRRACDEHLTGVRERSRQIISDTAEEARRLRDAASEAGRRDGYRDGLKSAEAEIEKRVEQRTAERLAEQLATVLPAVRQLGEQLQLERDRCVARWEGEAVRLAVAIAEKLLKRSLAVDPGAADRLIAETLRMAASSPELSVKLSPVDYERLGGSVTTLAEAIGRLGKTEVVADPAIDPGDSLVETRHGRVDGRLATMLQRIGDELTGTTDSACPAKASDGT